MAVALGVAIVNPTPALARNIGGIGGACASSPGPFVGFPGSNGVGQGAYCPYVVDTSTGQVLAGVTRPGSTCPPGILRLQGIKR